MLEAALGPLSAPRPTQDERDLRPSHQRRGEALVALVRRAVSSEAGGPSSTKAQLFVTVDLDTLRSRLTGAGCTVAGPDAGTLLAPETVRRLACDAAIIPVVLGSDAEVVDMGRAKRLFTQSQVRRLWLRDGCCTFPGCDIPAQWTDAHHLVFWADGGPTNLDNATLLCQRHHTVVHDRRLAGRLVNERTGVRVGDRGGGGAADRGGGGVGDRGGGAVGERTGGAAVVEWDLRQGSYDQLLAVRRAQEPA